MRLIAVTIASLGLAIGTSAYAEGPDDNYVRIYNLIQQADNLNQTGQKRSAFEKYTEAQTALKGIQTGNPDWNPKLIQFRLGYVARKIADFGGAPAPAAPAAPPAAKPAAEAAKPAAQAPVIAVEKAVETGPSSAELNNRLKSLMDDNQRLGSEKAVSEAKLREALSAQPATVDPKELAKAEDRLRELQKENDLLKTSLQQEKDKAPKTADSAVLDETKKLLAAAQQKINEQTQAIAALTEEKRVLEARVKAAAETPAPAAAVAAPAPVVKAVQAPAVTSTEAALAIAENEILKKRVIDLERQVQNPLAPAPKAAVSAAGGADKAGAKQVKQLEKEKSDLEKKLASATSELESLKKKKDKTKASETAKQIEVLQARLAALEVKKTPYTAEELAVLKKQPAPAVTEMSLKESAPVAAAAPAKAKELPAGVGALINEAQRDFAARKYDEAEKTKEVLSQDENNALTLGYLAVLYLEKGDLVQAEKAATKALAQDENDSKHLALVGIVKVRQQKFDEALAPLTRSVKANPNYALAQNYLGIALTEKGQREPAEAAFRKAVQIAPDYANAHHNLAFVYATQDPPFIELAKYHYQKALAGREPRNEALEKLIEGKK